LSPLPIRHWFALALMETLQDTLGVESFKAIVLSPTEQRRLIPDAAGAEAEHLLDVLYASPVPAPSTAPGFRRERHGCGRVVYRSRQPAAELLRWPESLGTAAAVRVDPAPPG
jgi:hypothetical protein